MPDLHLAVIIPSSLHAPQIPYLDQAIKSLSIDQKIKKSISTTICIVSSNRPSRRLKQRYPHVFFVKAASRAGFAELNNAALQFLETLFSVNEFRKPDFLLLLNDDARLAGDFYSVLQKCEAQTSINAPGADIFAPLILDAKNNAAVDSFGVEYFRSGYAKNNHSVTVPTTLATAGCMLIRWSFVQKFVAAYGFFFSTMYFYYLEDVDLSVRALMIGGKIERRQSLVAYHHGSVTSGGKHNTFSLRYTYRNILWMMVCCWPTQALVRNAPNILLVQMWVFLYSTLRCGVFTYPNLLVQTILSFPELLHTRRKILAAYTATDFAKVLSPFSFRTYHDKTIPAL